MRSLVLGLTAFAFSLSTMACSGADRPQTSDNSAGESSPSTSGDQSSDAPVDVCSEGDHVGCACDNEGASFDCGRVKRQVGTYESCAEGTSTCTDGKWGACLATREVGPS